ncbi:MerR family transcriptional regulator [Clostridium sp. YIM B02506]|uniref:MerR family transcriptional regulator n=1 Tax=Clostridium sp. YIM B02506 TaxID=2910680 RepID=UPI001EEDF82E|nr:MerR family transcriptional regulator [Clostridium sp. YIM B02506]
MQYYTVKEIADLTGVTIKTLYHYHKIGLLEPCKITDAGYRLYGIKELELLQQILFYRELEFTLEDIKKALEDEPNRIEFLAKQYKMLLEKKQRMDCILDTIEKSIDLSKKGVIMDKTKMFKGLNKEEWTEAISEQNEYLKDKYGYDMIQNNDVDVEKINKQALEAKQFTEAMINGLKSGWRVDDKRLKELIKEHVAFLNEHGTAMDENSFLNVTKFMIEDDFHRNMLESQQVGLSYYLYTAAENYAVKKI